MRRLTVKKGIVFLIITMFVFVGTVFASTGENYSEERVTGPSNGNHALDCTIIRPWDSAAGPDIRLYPIIVWGNGWGGNDVAGQSTTHWYKPLLVEWVVDGPYIVVAANQWSVQESDILACLEWILRQNDDPGSDYYGIVNPAKIGLAGHSQGAGAVVKAGDGEPKGLAITTVVAMNPYGPSWVDAANQDGPMMIITGSEDTTTPLSWTYPVFEAVQTNDQGGLFTILQGAGHNDISRYQTVVKLWWQFTLYDRDNAGKQLARILERDPWDSEYAITDTFDF